MQNDFTIENFHHFDGVRHADYSPNVGDIVNVINDITGIDNAGNTYTVAGSGWFSKNVAQIVAIGNDMVTIDDGSASSPIVIVHPPIDAFESASSANQLLFKPTVITRELVSGTTEVADKIVKTSTSVANGVIDFASKIGSNISWIIIVAVLIGGLILYSNLKRAL